MNILTIDNSRQSLYDYLKSLISNVKMGTPHDTDHVKRLRGNYKELQKMKKSELIALGINDEIADQVIIAHGKDIENHKAKITTAQTEIDALKAQMTEAGKTIEGFKKLDVDGIKAAADDYKAKWEAAQQDAQKQIAEVKFTHALETALAGAKVKNAKAVSALLSVNDLKLAEDGNILGLKEQLEKIKSENDYLFADDQPAPRIVAGGKNQSVVGDAVEIAAWKAAGLKPPTQKE